MWWAASLEDGGELKSEARPPVRSRAGTRISPCEVRAMPSDWQVTLDKVETITTCAERLREMRNNSEITDSRAFTRSFVKETEVRPDRAVIYSAIHTPPQAEPGRQAGYLITCCSRNILPSSTPTRRLSVRLGKHRVIITTVHITLNDCPLCSGRLTIALSLRGVSENIRPTDVTT